MARKVFNDQDEKYKRKRKYQGFYCCSDEEVEGFLKIFERLIAERERVDYDFFIKSFVEEESEGLDED